jgi:hypothetical protein
VENGIARVQRFRARLDDVPHCPALERGAEGERWQVAPGAIAHADALGGIQ